MSKDYRYYKLMNSPMWRHLRLKYITAHPMCEECGKRLAEEDHHKQPIQSAADFYSMKLLAFDENNLESVCSDCHHAIHNKMGSHLRNKEMMKAHQQRLIDNYHEKMFGHGKD